jgi:hypothetical protein
MMQVVGGRLHAEVVKAAQDGQRPLALHLLKRRKETEALLDQLRTHERSALTMLDELERVHTTRAMTDALDVGARAMQTAQRALPPVERIEALQDELAELADQNEAIRQALARGALLSTARGRCGRWLTRAGGVDGHRHGTGRGRESGGAAGRAGCVHGRAVRAAHQSARAAPGRPRERAHRPPSSHHHRRHRQRHLAPFPRRGHVM